jgi:hypothetical protein
MQVFSALFSSFFNLGNLPHFQCSRLCVFDARCNSSGLMKTKIPNKYFFCAFSLSLFSALLPGCGSGENVTLTTDNQGEDPVVVETPIAYIKRPVPDEPPEIRDPLRFQPGAQLLVRERAATAANDRDVSALIAEIVALEEGVSAQEIALDIKDLESSYDGKSLIFAVRAVPVPVSVNLQSSTWNLWLYDLESGEPRYLISSRIKRNEGVESGGGHDLAPHFLPDDRIVFSSTRQVTSQARQLDEGRAQIFAALDEDRRNPAAVLHVYDPQLRGDEFRQISFNLSHDLDPVVMANGDIVFSRWNNTATNSVSLFRIHPAGFGIAPLYGFHSQRSGSDGSVVAFSQPRELDDGRLISLLRPFAAQTLGGNLFVIDAQNFADVDQPLGSASGGAAAQQPLTLTEIRTDSELSPGGQFASVYPLRDGTGRLLVSWSDCRVIDSDLPASQGVDVPPTSDAAATPAAGRFLPCKLQPDNRASAPPLYGGWIYDPSSNTQRPVVLPQEGYYISELIAAEPREFPRVATAPQSFNIDLAQQGMAQLLIDSVYDLDGIDSSPSGIAVHAQPGLPAYLARPARFLRFTQPVPIPDPDVFAIPGYAAGVRGGSDYREILGYVPVEPDGSVSVSLPAGRPLTFEVLDAQGRRLGAAHDYWLQLTAGEVLRCTGCHAPGSSVPHGRADAALVSANGGAVFLPGGGLGFPGTRSSSLFATATGQTMAQVWDFHRPADDPAVTERPLSITPAYTDEWHAPGLPATPVVDDRAYPASWTDIPDERALVIPGFEANQPDRIVINYPDHIQPIWERTRAPRYDAQGNEVTSCLGCHSTGDDTRVPAGQLDLGAQLSDIDPNHLRSYRELLTDDSEQWLATDQLPADRVRQCTIVNDAGESVTVVENVRVRAVLRAGSANASVDFFRCFDGGACGPPASPALPANCIEDGEPIPATRNSVDHVGLLSAAELRLLGEWIDIGAQYFNNPFDDRLSDN